MCNDAWGRLRHCLQRIHGIHGTGHQALLGDTVLDKNFSHQIELVRLQYSGIAHSLIRNIGLVNCADLNPETEQYWVIDYRFNDPGRDGKSKLDHVHFDSLHRIDYCPLQPTPAHSTTAGKCRSAPNRRSRDCRIKLLIPEPTVDIPCAAVSCDGLSKVMVVHVFRTFKYRKRRSTTLTMRMHSKDTQQGCTADERRGIGLERNSLTPCGQDGRFVLGLAVLRKRNVMPYWPRILSRFGERLLGDTRCCCPTGCRLRKTGQLEGFHALFSCALSERVRRAMASRVARRYRRFEKGCRVPACRWD